MVKKRLFCVFMLFMVAFISITRVNAANTYPARFSINGSNLRTIYGSNYLGTSSTIQFSYKTNTNGQLVYCIEIHDGMPPAGIVEEYVYNGAMSDSFAYILSNNHPTGDPYKDYFITGLAVWYLINPGDSVFSNFNMNAGTYKGVSSDASRAISNLVKNSSLYSSYTAASIRINNSNSNLTLSSDGKYYVSSAMSVVTTGNIRSFNVSLNNAPSGTIITNASGVQKSSFSVTESFYVKVPVSSIKKLSTSFSVNAYATVTTNKAYKYSPTTNSAYQSVVTLYPVTNTVSNSTTLKVSVKPRVEIMKVDNANHGLAGAKLVVKDASGNVKDTWTSTTTAHVISDLPVGKYYLTEINPPSGYKLNSNAIMFEITSSSVSTIKKSMINYPDVYVEISKQDATTGKELPGAKLKLTYPDGSSKSWTSTSTPYKLKNLPAGKYTLTETTAPSGYKLNKEKVTFTVQSDGTVKNPVIMKNYPDVYVEISKQDATTGKELPGAKLKLTYPDGSSKSWISTSTPYKLKNLPAGKYTLTETTAPSGYKLSTEKVTFTVQSDGTVKNPVVMKNYPDKYVIVSKQDATTGKELPGATLVLKDSGGKIVESWVSGTAPYQIKNLPAGKYTLTETIAPEGYELSTEEVTFIVQSDGNVKSPVVMKNYPKIPGAFYISKQDATTGKELPGATLVLKSSDGTYIDSWISGDTPHEVKDLPGGTYTLTETIAPEGYELSKETVTFVVDEDGTTKEPVVMKNYPKPGVFYISKQDATTGEELPGARLELKDLKGNVLYEWTSSEKPYKIEGLEGGTYILTETLAPKGYVLNKETIKFVVNDDGTVDEPIIMKNELAPEPLKPLPTGDGLISVAFGLGFITLIFSIYFLTRHEKNVEIN